jgi:hypothetical protein
MASTIALIESQLKSMGIDHKKIPSSLIDQMASTIHSYLKSDAPGAVSHENFLKSMVFVLAKHVVEQGNSMEKHARA